jgi:hypothetical protein
LSNSTKNNPATAQRSGRFEQDLGVFRGFCAGWAVEYCV